MRNWMLVSLAALVGGCADTVPRSDFDKLQAELGAVKARAESAERELEAFKTNPAQLLAEAKSALGAGQFAAARAAAEKLVSKHPSDPGVAEAQKIRAEAERQESEAADRKAEAGKQKAEAEKKRVAASLKSMRVEKDEIRGIEFYSHQDAAKFLNSRSELAVYFAARNGRPDTLFFRIQYVADDWLFVQSYTIKADDAVFEIEPARGQLQRDNGSGNIWEWFEVPVGRKERATIDAMLSAKRVTVRYHGKQYYKDRVIPPAEIDRMRQVLAAFNAM